MLILQPSAHGRQQGEELVLLAFLDTLVGQNRPICLYHVYVIVITSVSWPSGLLQIVTDPKRGLVHDGIGIVYLTEDLDRSRLNRDDETVFVFQDYVLWRSFQRLQ